MFDKFPIGKHLSEAVDQIRRRENKQLRARGDERLTGTRDDWLKHPAKMEPEDKKVFALLSDSNLKTARAVAAERSDDGLLFVYLQAARAQTLSLVA